MTTRTWIRSLFARTTRTVRKAPARCRPRVEALEDRLAPATFTVYNLNDAGLGSLRQAILDANGNPGADDIVFDGALNGTLLLDGSPLPTITDDLTIAGPTIAGPEAEPLKIDAQWLSRIFETAGADVTISDLIVIRGLASEGGAIYTSGGTLTLIRSAVGGSEATASGGGIYSDGGAITLITSVVGGNYAAASGGGIYSDGGTVTLRDDSAVASNATEVAGGGIYALGGTLLLNGGFIQDNVAGITGGGIHGEGATVTLTDSTIILNTVGIIDADAGDVIGGGGLYIKGGGLTATGSQVLGNEAVFTIGGGIRCVDAKVDLTDCMVSVNAAPQFSGGGLFSTRSTVTLTDCTLSQNVALVSGGIACRDGALTLIRTTVSYNRAEPAFSPFLTQAGGIGQAGGELTVTDCIFDGNSARHVGGAIITTGTATVSGTTFVDNVASTEDAGAILNNGSLTVTDCTFTQNLSLTGGGAIVNTGSMTVTNSTFALNVVAGEERAGGAIYNRGSVTVTGCTFTDNGAPLGGAIMNAVDIDDSKLSVTNTGFITNRAFAGGAIYNESDLAVTDCTFTSNEAVEAAAIASFDKLTVTGTTFDDNEADLGGAIVNYAATTIGAFTFRGEATVTGSTFAHNRAEEEGGAIFNLGELAATDSTFTANTVGAASAGGAISNGGELTVTGSTFEDNTAGAEGGAILNFNVLSVSGSTFKGNVASRGGAIGNLGERTYDDVTSHGLATVAGSTFTANTAGASIVGSVAAGGAVLNLGLMTVTGSAFTGNTAVSPAYLVAETTGGAVSNSGTLTVTGSTFTGNTADGAVGVGGAVFNRGVLTLAGSTLGDNTADFGGGLVNGTYDPDSETMKGEATIADSVIRDNSAAVGGGGVVNRYLLTLTRTTVSGNATPGTGGGVFSQGNAIQIGGVFTNVDSLTVTDCTIDGNAAGGDGGGIGNTGTVAVTNSTISGNTAGGNGGGIWHRNSLGTIANYDLHSYLTVSGSTLTGNAAGGDGGGIYSQALVSGLDRMGLSNTIVAGNLRDVPVGPDPASDLAGEPVAAGSSHNLIGDAATSGGLTDGVGGNIVGVDVALVLDPVLADNGGPTRTHALVAGSPALNAVDPPPGLPTTDQRGFERVSGGRLDLGAVEAQRPTVALTGANSITVSEGAPATNTGTFDDAEGRGTVTLTASLGTLTRNDAAGTWGWSYTPPDGPNGPTTVTIIATDDTGLTDTTTFTLTVNNAAPTASVPSPADAVRGQARVFTLTASDPSSVDQATGFTFSITWGDGTTQTVTGPSGTTVSHVYTASGSYPVQVTARDKDQATSAAVTQTVTVTAVALQTDPFDASKTALVVGGTLAGENITLKPADAAGLINVRIGPNSLGDFRPTGHIFVHGQAGDDTLRIQSNVIGGATVSISVPAFLFGDDGNDTLNTQGSSANNVLQGGAGADQIQAGSGRDLLIGGRGADLLRGDGGDDILIGGTTDFDANLVALNAIMAEWGRRDAGMDYPTRVNHLSGAQGGGLNQGYLLTAATVHDDGDSDTLWGEGDTDWFFAMLTGPGSNRDRVRDNSTGEIITPL